MKSVYAFLAVTAVSAASQLHAAVISWSFNSDTAGATTGSSFDSGTPTNFSLSGFGGGSGTVSISNSSGSTSYAEASGGNNITLAAQAGALSTASSSFYSVSITADTGFIFTLSDFDFGVRSTSTGPTSFDLRVGPDFTTSLATGTIANDLNWVFKDNTLTPFTSSEGQSIQFRLYVFGGSSASGGNSRLDDVSLVITTTPIPEPSAFVAALVGGFGLFAIRRVKRAAIF